LGWTAVFIQAVLAVIPIFMLCYVVFGRATGERDAFDFTDYLAFVGLAILGFTTFWSYRYTRLARRIADPDHRPPQDSIISILWVGLWASCLGIIVSLLALMIEVVRLLILFLKAPQGGVPVIQTQANNRAGWVSAIDAVSLLAEVCTIAGEFLVLGITLWLLFRVTRLAGDYAESIATPES
jgi:hypothetical protein